MNMTTALPGVSICLSDYLATHLTINLQKITAVIEKKNNLSLLKTISSEKNAHKAFPYHLFYFKE